MNEKLKEVRQINYYLEIDQNQIIFIFKKIKKRSDQKRVEDKKYNDSMAAIEKVLAMPII